MNPATVDKISLPSDDQHVPLVTTLTPPSRFPVHTLELVAFLAVDTR